MIMDKEKKSEIHITNNFNAPIGQHIDHVDTINFKMDGDGTFHFGMIENMPDNTDDDHNSECFKHTSDFVKEEVGRVVMAFYKGEHTGLALIEVVLFDHGLLKKRNQHKAFVRTLVAWGILNADEVEQKRMVNGIKTKFKSLPTDGYLSWGKPYDFDKNVCKEIGKALSSTIPYQR